MIEYKVRVDQGGPTDVFEVIRYEGGHGWHIGTYTHRVTADLVVSVHTSLARYEVKR